MPRNLTDLTDEEWLDALSGKELPGVDPLVVPKLPPEALQVGTVGLSGRAALVAAMQFAGAVKEVAARYRHPLGVDSTVLDFGAGWGRIARFFVRGLAPGRLVCADVDERLLAHAAEAIPSARCIVSKPYPPIGLDDASVDLVYAYSVFSHLSEAAATAWLAEFARVLKPGGLACLTTRPREHIESGGMHLSLDPRTPPDVVEAGRRALSAAYDQGRFAYVPMQGKTLLTGDFYGEAAIPEGYAARWG